MREVMLVLLVGLQFIAASMPIPTLALSLAHHAKCWCYCNAVLTKGIYNSVLMAVVLPVTVTGNQAAKPLVQLFYSLFAMVIS
jgi:hypothetical protein